MEITQACVRELFDYDPESGVLIAKKRQKGRKFGKPVGCKSGNYLLAMVEGRLYKVHRLIFLWHHGYMPEVIDHIDRNGMNNRIENLRAATPLQNTANRGLNRNNTSGFKGASYDKRRNRWAGQMMVNRKHVFLGYFDTPEDAHAAYVKATRELYGEFSGV